LFLLQAAPTSESAATKATVAISLRFLTSPLPSHRSSSRSFLSLGSCWQRRRTPPFVCSAPRARVQGVAKPVADEVERQRREHQTESGEEQHPPGKPVELPARGVGDHAAPRRCA